jgi:Tat protein translocase TatB subunit
MFGSIGGFEILVLLGIGLLVFGPRRLPEMGRWVARGLGELRRAAADVKSAVEQEADLSEVTKVAGELKQAVNTEARRLFTDLETEAAQVRDAASVKPAGARRTGGAPTPPAAGEEGRVAGQTGTSGKANETNGSGSEPAREPGSEPRERQRR